MRLILLAVLLTVSSGCTSMIRRAAYTQRDAVVVEESEFEPKARFLGIQVPYEGHPFNRYFLRSWVQKSTGEATHQLYVVNYYSSDWRFWTRANGQDAEPLEFVEIESDVVSCSGYSGCLHNEDFGISIPDAVLRAHAGGYSVKAYARSGDTLVVTVTARQISAQIEAIDRYRVTRGGATQTQRDTR